LTYYIWIAEGGNEDGSPLVSVEVDEAPKSLDPASIEGVLRELVVNWYQCPVRLTPDDYLINSLTALALRWTLPPLVLRFVRLNGPTHCLRFELETNEASVIEDPDAPRLSRFEREPVV
jgi:hypothetical protein